MKRTETCNGTLLADLRTGLGLTQRHLAKAAGYCERLIRKAESGEAISYSAIKDIATVFCKNGSVVLPEDLICNPTQLTRQFLQAFANFEAEMVPHVEHFIDSSFVLFCAGDPQIIPFAGEWKGIEGLNKWVRCYFSTLIRPQKDFYQPEIIPCKNTVIAWGKGWAHAPNIPFPPVWVTQKLVFSKGKLIRFENLFDTDSGRQHMDQIRDAS